MRSQRWSADSVALPPPRLLADLDDAFFGPGTAPLTRSEFSSGSTAWTRSPTCVTRLEPIWPAIFCREDADGVAEAPIEPGLRTLCEPCGPDRGEVVPLDRPAKPLPIEIPRP